jgi:hypothetical protein
MIMLSNAVANPKAMMVKPFNACLALLAMFCPVFTDMLADRTEVARRFMVRGQR